MQLEGGYLACRALQHGVEVCWGHAAAVAFVPDGGRRLVVLDRLLLGKLRVQVDWGCQGWGCQGGGLLSAASCIMCLFIMIVCRARRGWRLRLPALLVLSPRLV